MKILKSALVKTRPGFFVRCIGVVSLSGSHRLKSRGPRGFLAHTILEISGSQSTQNIFFERLPPFSLVRDFSNQNACGNVSKISVNHTDDIPYMTLHFVPASNSSKMAKWMKI